jgi:hypothetical protein
LLFQPMAETRSKQHLPVNRRAGIPLCALRSGKRANVCGDRAIWCSRQNHFVVDNVLHGGLPSPLLGDDKESRLCRQSFVQMLVERGRRCGTRHSQER